ncbi:cyclodeaminase/cyclohydrolase family protein [Flavobacterium sp. LB3P122]|uniref:cyclodeaminase/cyclohydrolase family protein n=1 Tax=Flavobacterium algoriphilum TaxID=3398738 RepID=UPI003A898580
MSNEALKLQVDNEIQKYLELPTSELLDLFGQGSHIPGSGSAAALSALIAIELLKTVCILTRTKETYSNVHIQMDYIKEELITVYKPKLIELFYKDSKEFARVSELRMLRDNEQNQKQKEKYGREAIDQLRIATEIPIEMCNTCIKLMEFALSIFDNGYKATRGDAGVAISNLLAGISGTLFVILLNIKVSRKSNWTETKRKEAEELALKYIKIQNDAFSRVVSLYKDGMPDGQTEIPFI